MILYSLPKCLLCSDEGKVKKVLKVEPFPDGSGFFFNLGNPLSFMSLSLR